MSLTVLLLLVLLYLADEPEEVTPPIRREPQAPQSGKTESLYPTHSED